MTAIAALALIGARCMDLGSGFLDCEREGRFALFVPEKPTRGRAAIVLLHGAGRNRRTLIDNPETRAALASSRAVILMPDGGASWWLEPARSRVLDLLDAVEKPLRLSRGPKRRAITGWSMGGFGSLALITLHPSRFAAWAGTISLADFPNPAYPKERNHSVPPVFGQPESWPSHNPMARVAALRGKKARIATGDRAYDRAMNESLRRRLEELGIEHEFQLHEGGHEFAVVARELPLTLRFLQSAMR